MPKIDFSIILACYNEGSTFERSVAKIISVLGKIKKNWEIIFVDDKSDDETRRVVEKLTSQTKNFKAIYHQKNQGRGKSVADGLKIAHGNICGYLDVDLEVSADYIPIFIEEIEKGADVAIGRRFYEGGIRSILRFLASKVYSSIVRILLAIPLEDTEAGYKFFRRSKILPIAAKTRDSGWFWDTEICTRSYFAGLKISEIPVLFIRRREKKSTVRLFTDSWDYLIKIFKFRSQIAKLRTQK